MGEPGSFSHTYTLENRSGTQGVSIVLTDELVTLMVIAHTVRAF